MHHSITAGLAAQPNLIQRVLAGDVLHQSKIKKSINPESHGKAGSPIFIEIF
jgi:hypothetical protein